MHNVGPRFIAWWLDATHQPVPYEVLASRQALDGEGLAVPRMPQGTLFKLPDGVEKLAADEPQNAIVTSGSTEGLRELREQVTALDRPLKQVAVEAYFASVDAEGLKAFDITFQPVGTGALALNAGGDKVSGMPTYFVGGMRPDYLGTLKALEVEKHARIVAAPRVTAINGLPASIYSSVATPMVLPASSDGLQGPSVCMTRYVPV